MVNLIRVKSKKCILRPNTCPRCGSKRQMKKSYSTNVKCPKCRKERVGLFLPDIKDFSCPRCDSNGEPHGGKHLKWDEERKNVIYCVGEWKGSKCMYHVYIHTSQNRRDVAEKKAQAKSEQATEC